MTRFPQATSFCLSVFIFGALGACGGAPEPATPAGTPAGAAPGAPGAPGAPAAPAAWTDDMPKDQKMAFMKANVAPRMGKVFQGMNAQHYADFGCKTCHGPDWKLPKDKLPKLAMKDG